MRGRIYINQSISFTPDQLAAAKARAHAKGQSLSHYVRDCIELELRSGEPPLRLLDSRVAENRDSALAQEQAPSQATARGQAIARPTRARTRKSGA